MRAGCGWEYLEIGISVYSPSLSPVSPVSQCPSVPPCCVLWPIFGVNIFHSKRLDLRVLEDNDHLQRVVSVRECSCSDQRSMQHGLGSVAVTNI